MRAIRAFILALCIIAFTFASKAASPSYIEAMTADIYCGPNGVDATAGLHKGVFLNFSNACACLQTNYPRARSIFVLPGDNFVMTPYTNGGGWASNNNQALVGTTTIHLGSMTNVTISGIPRASKLKSSGDYGGIFSFSNMVNFTVQGIMFEGNRDNIAANLITNTVAAVASSGTNYGVTFRQCQFSNWIYNAIGLQDSTVSPQFTQAQQTYKLTVIDCDFDQIGNTGSFFDANGNGAAITGLMGDDFVAYNNKFNYCSYCITMGGYGEDTTVRPKVGWRVLNNVFTNYLRAAITIGNPSAWGAPYDVVIQNNSFHANPTYMVSPIGSIAINSATNVSILGNTIMNDPWQAIWIGFNANNADGVVIQDNTIIGGSRIGVFVSTRNDGLMNTAPVIKGNTFRKVPLPVHMQSDANVVENTFIPSETTSSNVMVSMANGTDNFGAGIVSNAWVANNIIEDLVPGGPMSTKTNMVRVTVGSVKNLRQLGNQLHWTTLSQNTNNLAISVTVQGSTYSSTYVWNDATASFLKNGFPAVYYSNFNNQWHVMNNAISRYTNAIACGPFCPLSGDSPNTGTGTVNYATNLPTDTHLGFPNSALNSPTNLAPFTIISTVTPNTITTNGYYRASVQFSYAANGVDQPYFSNSTTGKRFWLNGNGSTNFVPIEISPFDVYCVSNVSIYDGGELHSK